MSGQVLTIHGIAPAVIPKTFCFRNICDADVMAQYLTSVPPFVPLVDAIAGRGDALVGFTLASVEIADPQRVEAMKNHPINDFLSCLLYTSPSPRDGLLSRMPSSA